MRIALIFLTAIFAAACGNDDGAAIGESAGEAGVVNIYSGRHYDSDYVLFDAFEEETGVKINVVEARGDALIERLAREGEATPADLFLTADAGILWRGQERGVFKPIDDESVLSRAPAHLRNDQNLWIALSKRARIIIYDKEAGLPEGLATYEDLADPAYRGMICIRSSSNVYNQSLLASVVARLGEEAAQQWAAGVVANFARDPQGNDTAQIEAVAAGDCRLAVVNSYYVARYVGVDDPEKAAIGDRIGVLFPNQETSGAHVNISGAALTLHGANEENALKLIAFLLRDDVQADFARGNNEYPAVEGVSAEGPIAALGEFREDDLNVSRLGELQAVAVRIFDRVGWR